MPLLHIGHLTRSFGATRALTGVDLSIERGEIVALMGANGAGKSTLVKILSGVLAPDSGVISLNGVPFAPRTPSEAAHAGIATVHQSTDIVGAAGLTVADVLLLNRLAERKTPFFVSRRSLRRQARIMLDAPGFSLPLDRDFGDLSAADRQLVAIARALADKAELLILDEPTASLSGDESRRLFNILLKLRSQGLAILYISHRTTDLEAIADRAIVMRGGQVVRSFRRPIDFSSAIEAMIGRRLEVARPNAGGQDGRLVFEMRNARLVPTSLPFDLTIKEGEVVAITGALGVGKSRLLSAIFGASRLAGGEMVLDGQPHAPRSPAEAIAAGVAMAAEDRHRSSLMPEGWPGHALAATISLPHLAKWYRRGFLFGDRELRETDKAISRLGIKASDPLASIWSLSGGNQQKAVIARWEAEPGRLLLLDEPFQGIDVGARRDIIEAIRARADRATLIATSDPEEAYEVADRILNIDRHTLWPIATANPATQGTYA
ncbi:sugar ABC transporter ATP-binding protein [Rhizobium cauense]|uniref:sugar ABC transporter ATP-binding protein n=1 Tax=Rhizobium cauense TaxID=1166683 RepID=UPI001C6EBA11|nr:sugar ABC transporter ATP-binding protein [Rhizobium cauense]MBW9113842.1 sugar ABC transporter ATP-binding protein [Rhizobium cauense]